MKVMELHITVSNKMLRSTECRKGPRMRGEFQWQAVYLRGNAIYQSKSSINMTPHYVCDGMCNSGVTAVAVQL